MTDHDAALGAIAPVYPTTDALLDNFAAFRAATDAVRATVKREIESA